MDGNKFARQLTQMARNEFARANTDFEYAGNKLTKRAIRHYGTALGLLEAARQIPFQPIAAHEVYDTLEDEWHKSEFAAQYRKHAIIDAGPKPKHTQA